MLSRYRIVSSSLQLFLQTRQLGASSFHGYLELAAAALFFVRGTGPLAPQKGQPGPASAHAGPATPAPARDLRF